MYTRTGDRFAPDLTVKELYVCYSDPDYLFPNQVEGNKYLSNYSNMEQLEMLNDIDSCDGLHLGGLMEG